MLDWTKILNFVTDQIPNRTKTEYKDLAGMFILMVN